MTSALRQVFQEALKLPDDQQNSLATVFEKQLYHFKGSRAQTNEAEITKKIKRGMAEIKAGKSVDARVAMRQIAQEFGIRTR